MSRTPRTRRRRWRRRPRTGRGGRPGAPDSAGAAAAGAAPEAAAAAAPAAASSPRHPHRPTGGRPCPRGWRRRGRPWSPFVWPRAWRRRDGRAGREERTARDAGSGSRGGSAGGTRARRRRSGPERRAASKEAGREGGGGLASQPPPRRRPRLPGREAEPSRSACHASRPPPLLPSPRPHRGREGGRAGGAGLGEAGRGCWGGLLVPGQPSSGVGGADPERCAEPEPHLNPTWPRAAGSMVLEGGDPKPLLPLANPQSPFPQGRPASPRPGLVSSRGFLGSKDCTQAPWMWTATRPRN